MLYATTRSNSHVETTYKAVHQDRCSDGGLFVPFRLPSLEREQILALKDKSFGQNMADILNLFFSCNLSVWDVDFTMGKNTVQMNSIPHRIFIAETWHCRDNRFQHAIDNLSLRLEGEQTMPAPTNWVRIAVRIATIFASYGLLLASGQVDVHTPLDVAVTTGDFSAPMAAWYAREMGLPLGNIICGCNANGAVWDLLHRGEMATNAISAKTNTPEADVTVPENLERLVAGVLGRDHVHAYLDKCRTGQQYTLSEENLEKLSRGMFASVISDSRVESIIHSVYRTNGYVFSPYAALAYGSLLDYRAKTSQSRPAMLLSEKSPVCDCDMVARSMNVPIEEVLKIVSIG